MMEKKVYFWIKILIIFFWIYGCASTKLQPFTEVSLKNLEEDEKSLWKSADEIEFFLNKNVDIFNDKELEQYLTKIVNKISPVKEIHFRVKVINDTALNAFALPNGAIYINIGLLAKMQNEDQLVTVLGHEMSHVILRHSISHWRDIKNKTCIYQITSTVLLPTGPLALLQNTIGYKTMIACIQGYSRELETQADSYGFNIMMKNGYDPNKGIKIYYQLLKETRHNEKKIPYFFSSHPRMENRIKNLKSLIKKFKTKLIPKKNDLDEYKFIQKAKKAIIYAIKKDIDFYKYESAKRTIQLHNKILSSNGEFQCLKGYLYYKQNNKIKSKQIFNKIIKEHNASCTCICCPQKYLGLLMLKENKDEAKFFLEEYIKLSKKCCDHSFIKSIIYKNDKIKDN